ncbi:MULTISPECIES: hypothetical protein [unclassified Streptomyces]|uniref:hypothetical protein n=1 Tax=unclassified Streptomyces TaxID=2593676 RepID=UPI0004AE5ED7|nr:MULTISPECIES: hypothetical protein [unclassified Streptomyces]MYY16790.1 hypothetical protein [Streptomyces sp. SID4912]SCD34643.1 hypothetical protein GA0115241_100952 [Streptomyces sp. DpondAA-D4]
METPPTTPATDHDHDADGEPATDQKAAPGLTKTAEPVSTKGAESSKEAESPGVPGPENAVPAGPGPEDAPASDAPDPDAHGDDALEPDPYDEAEATASAEAGSGAAAVVAAGLGVVSLSGAWTGRVAAERETLIGQIKSSSGGSGSATQQISEIYGNAWHTTALVNGLFALLALLVGVFVLVRPAFGAPAAHPRPGWIRAVARAGIALGILGVLISVVMYFDLALPLPTAG